MLDAERVGQGIKSAAAGVEHQLRETKIQAVVDNMKGMDGVGVELAGDGDVTLVGTVPDEKTKQEAERLVLNIKGVTTVTNALKVSGQTSPAPDSVHAQPDSSRGTTM
jgi:hypothetical protein